MDCPFCEIVKNKTERMLKETEYSFVVLSNPKLMPGHLLVIPKKHIERLSELNEAERRDLFNEVISLQDKVLETISTGCDVSQHYRPFIPKSKFKVSHLHFHVRPRELDDELYKKTQYFEKDVFQDLEESEIDYYKKLLFG
ncbi:MAG: histidine triad (HIT) protein [Parcubacteria group bacterium Gr01-1014_46]|nr:MAG: histidine triad (HIT) protein [Parcubacteria group bacterium Gr01-1014_46]